MSDKPTARPVLVAIANVMSSVGAVDKRGKNSFHNYEYATAGDIMHALQKRMASEGLVITANQRKVEFFGNDSVMLVEFGFDVQHTSGDKLDEPLVFSGMAGCKNKNGSFDDKAVNKCLVGAMKYFMLHLFKIPTGDYHDADADGEPVAPQAAPQSPPQRRQPPKAPAKHSTPANGKARAGEASTQPNDAIPFGEDGGEVLYVNTQGRDTPLDLADAVSRLEKAAEATTSLPDEEFAGLMNANAGWLTGRAPAALKALFAARNMDAADWLR